LLIPFGMLKIKVKDIVFRWIFPSFPDIGILLKNVRLRCNLREYIYFIHFEKEVVHPEGVSALLIDHEFVVTSGKEFRVDVLLS
jgi:hypothetical protein